MLYYIDIHAICEASPVIRLSPARAEALDGLRVIIAALTQSARAVESRTGITNAQLFLLQQLRAGPLSVSQLAERARTHQSTVSIVLARLSRAGLVAKERSAEDGRRAVVSVTTAGRALLRRAPAPPAADLLRAVERLSPRDARRLADGLRALVHSLGLGTHPPTLLFEHPRAAPSRVGRSRKSGTARAAPSRREKA